MHLTTPFRRRPLASVTCSWSFVALLLAACHDGHRRSPAAVGTSVRIDAYPTRQFNQFAVGSTTPIEVDVFTDSAGPSPFLATDIDVASVRFGPGLVAPTASAQLDADGDGDIDLRLTFPAVDVGLTASTTSVTLTGRSNAGVAFTGSDQVVEVPIDPDDPSLPELVYFANPTDSRLLRATLPDGTVLDYYGSRDFDGRPTALRSVSRSNTDGSYESLLLDEFGRPTSFEGRDGTWWSFEWLDEQRLVASFRAPGVAGEARAVVDLAAVGAKIGSTPRATGIARHAMPHAEAMPLLPALPALPEFQPGEVAVFVTRCGGQPVDDALRVEVIYSSGFTLERRPAYPRGNGLYVAQVPVGPGSLFEDLGSICGGLEGILSVLCDFGFANFFVAAMPQICSTLTAAAAPIPGLPAAVAAACPTAIGGLAIYCETLGQSGQPGPDSLAKILCSALNSSIDSALASDNKFSARAVIASPLGTGTTTYPGPSFADVPIPGPLPVFTIDVGSTPGLGQGATSPPDPAPFEGYEFSVAVECVPAGGATAVLSISGTDGYQNSSAVLLSEDGVATLYVPGAEDGVVDTLQAVLFQYQGGTILDQVTISITF